MTLSEIGYPQADYVWVSLDSKGVMGVFVTAGEGPIPVAVLRDETIAIGKLEKLLLELPDRCDVSIHITYPKMDSFLGLGKLGFFVFDWSDVHRSRADEIGAYEKVCSPSVPIVLSELSPELQSYLSGLAVIDADFANAVMVDPRPHVQGNDVSGETTSVCKNQQSREITIHRHGSMGDEHSASPGNWPRLRLRRVLGQLLNNRLNR